MTQSKFEPTTAFVADAPITTSHRQLPISCLARTRLDESRLESTRITMPNIIARYSVLTVTVISMPGSITVGSPMVNRSLPVNPYESAFWPDRNCSGTIPIPTKFDRWMRSKDCARTARIPCNISQASTARAAVLPRVCSQMVLKDRSRKTASKAAFLYLLRKLSTAFYAYYFRKK